VVTDDDVEIRYAVPTTEGSLHTRFCQLRLDYLSDPAALPLFSR
jgi:site-specific DNA recombinase